MASDPPQQPEHAHDADSPAATHDVHPVDDNQTPGIKEEEETAAQNGHGDDGTASRPAKRQKLESLTPRRSLSRAASPPWKSFAADGPTTIFDNGVRKSSRVNREAPTPPEPLIKKPSRNGVAKGTQTNGTSKSSSKQSSRAVSIAATSAKPKTSSATKKKAPAPPLQSPTRKSERNKKPSTATLAISATSPAVAKASPETSRKRPGRARKSTLISTGDALQLFDPDRPDEDAHITYDDQWNPADMSNSTNSAAPRIRLRFRRLTPPTRHPHHLPPARKHASFAEWLQHDDALEGEDVHRITEEKAKEEADRRLQIADAAERGVLSLGRCSIFQPEPADEPPPKYRHWDHVVNHALTFNKLLREENAYHRKMAKTLAREAHEYWKEKYKRKSQDEIDQEEADRTLYRYKQLVKDVKDTWANVRMEIDKERVAKWEAEQVQLGHKAMDDMFNQAQEILGRTVVDSASSLVSDDRDTDGEGGDFGSGTSQVSDEADVDHQMTSGSESDEGHDDDEDANLTAEQLRAKYEQLPDLPDDSSSVDDDQQVGEDENGDEVTDDADRSTPGPTPDSDLEMAMQIDMETGDEPPVDPFANTNGSQDEYANGDEKKPDYIDPATVELDTVDEALLDSDDGASGSGSEEWPSDEDEDSDEDPDEDGEDEEGQSASGSEAGDADVGVMGFLTPAEIKKLKESAKTVVDDVNADNEIALNGTHDMNGTNGVHEEEEGVEITSDTNGTIEDVGTANMGCVSREDVPEATPASMENDVNDIDMEDETKPEKAVSRIRSRHSSEPARVEVPSLLRGTLREYQHDGLDWLVNLYDSDTNGILADEMGLGKTIQTISVLAYVAIHRQKWGPHLVVVPTSVMLNWEMEFKKFLPGFKILTYYGDIAERKRKRIGWRNTGRDMINVVITSYQLILQDAAAFKMRAWQYLVLDEAHNIKNFKSQRWQTMLNLRTERRLLLTGTPLQNNIDELWSLLYFLMPAGFAGEGRIAGLEEFTMALKNPTSQILEQGRQQLDVEAQKIVKKLHEVLRPYLLRRLKADVEKQMPGKYEHVVYCKLSKRQRQLYDGFMGRASTKEILSSGNYMSIINCLMSLRKVCNHPDLFETRAIVTSMAMSKSVAARFEIKDFLIRKRLSEGMEDEEVSLEALNLVFAHRERTSMLQARRAQQIRATRPLEDLIEVQTRRINQATEAVPSSIQSTLAAMANRERTAVRDHLRTCLKLTRARTQFLPIYGKGLIDRLTMDYENYAFGAREPEEQITRPPQPPYNNPAYGPPGMQYHQPNPFGHAPVSLPPVIGIKEGRRGRLGFRQPLRPAFASLWHQQKINAFTDMVPTLEQRAEALEPLVTRFTCVTPAVAADELAPLTLSNTGVQLVRSSEMAHRRDPFHESRIRQSIAFPDKRLLQYDCGKLQRLATLLRDLQAGGHRALIFTQMTKVLDILEQFLNIHGHRYLRLDGATKVEQRQILTDRFNNDPRILCFILSSRSGGLGINLTGADTVIFYDLDWNPAMDKQCQDRSHRIGQTRDVHIYKFVSEYTIEANILRKSNQKRLLDDVIIQKGDFTTDTFNRVTWRDALDDGLGDEAGAAMDRVLGEKAGLLGDARVMGTVEDREDMAAATVAQKEIVDEIHDDQVDFSESAAATPGGATRAGSELGEEMPGGLEGERLKRHVDEYMLGRFRDEYGREPYKPPTDRQRRHRKGGDVHRTHKKKRY
ncbi:swr1 complex component [Paraconiothyrium brasiliense]|uniref:Swr1 complex component n=1 Tax=Paraconiothyrium brasiliense TaxID=300254 RepID=A0ABR3S7H1_9PLEO